MSLDQYTPRTNLDETSKLMATLFDVVAASINRLQDENRILIFNVDIFEPLHQGQAENNYRWWPWLLSTKDSRIEFYENDGERDRNFYCLKRILVFIFFYILLTNESYSINYLIELFNRYKNKLFRKFEQMNKEYCGWIWSDHLNFLEEKCSETSSVEKCSFDNFNQAE